MEKIQDFKPEHEYLKNQEIEKSKKSKIRKAIDRGLLYSVGLLSLASLILGYTDRVKLKKQVYEIADTNNKNGLENRELLELGGKLEDISGDSYAEGIFKYRGNSYVISFKNLERKINRTPNWVYREFLKRYGDKKLKENR